MKFLHLIFQIFDVFSKARGIKQNEDTRKKSVIFGITSIVYLILAVACAFGGAFLFTVTDNLLVIFIIIVAVSLLIFSVIFLLGALLRLIAQFMINRNAMSWIALAVFIAAIAGTAFVIAHFLG